MRIWKKNASLLSATACDSRRRFLTAHHFVEAWVLRPLQQLYPRLCISAEVHGEVVIAGAGLPGESQVANSEWIEVRSLQNQASLFAAHEKFGLGLGELSTILLGKEMHADAVLLDDFRARKLAKEEGLAVRGSVGLLEALHRRGYLADLRAAFQQLLAQHVYIDQRLLDRRLRSLGIPPL